MGSAQALATTLITGTCMTRQEFLSRWDQLPGVRHAELIDGIVHVPSPLTIDHGQIDWLLGFWLGRYAEATPGCMGGHNTTWIMSDSAPQPDLFLRILPEFGGQSEVENRLGKGAPELVIEVCLTSTEVDFGPKLRLYERAGVREYITVELLSKTVAWRELIDGSLVKRPANQGLLKSGVFPGLWLDMKALWEERIDGLSQTLQIGLSTPEHQAFVERLRSSRR